MHLLLILIFLFLGCSSPSTRIKDNYSSSLCKVSYVVSQNNEQVLQDGLLGLTKEQIRNKFGKPYFIEVYDWTFKKNRIFSLDEWDAIGRRLYGLGEDVYFFKTTNNELRYSFHYLLDTTSSKFHPKTRLNSYSIEFDQPIRFGNIDSVIEQLSNFKKEKACCYLKKRPLVTDTLICVVNGASTLAKKIRSLGISKPKYTQWNIDFRLKACEGTNASFTQNRKICEVTISTGSIEEQNELVRLKYNIPANNPFKLQNLTLSEANGK